MEPRPPVVWVPSMDQGAHIIGWHHTPDGWWAHLRFLATRSARTHAESFTYWELTVRASLVQPRTGYEYTQVPRT